MDLTIINTVWRPVYGELIQGLRLLTPEWANLKKLKNFRQLSPRAINWPVDLQFGGGIAATTDGGSLARAESNAPVEATDTWRHFVGRFEIGYDELVDEGDSKFVKQEIEKQVRYQAMDKLRSFRRAVAMMFYGQSTGVLFNLTSVNDGADTFVVQDLYGVSGLAVPSRLRDYLTVNKDTVAILDTSNSDAELVRAKVISLDDATDTVGVTSGTDLSGAAATDKLTLANQVITGDADTDNDIWMHGLLDITRAASLHGLATSAYPDWVAGVDESSYGTVRGGNLYKFFEDINMRSNYPVQWAYTTVGAIAEMGASELDQRRYGSEDNTMRMGFKSLNVMGVSVQARPYVPGGYMFIGSNGALRKLSPDEGSPTPKNVVDSGEKAGSFQQYTNRLGFYKDQIFRAQLTAVQRLGLGVVSGITEAS
jgi:hypothetical protein